LQDFTAYNVESKLENLSEGNHTVTAYANDMSTSVSFTVNSHYQVTVVKILSPMNQVFNPVRLIFTVNGEVKEAYYYMYRGLKPPYEAVYAKSFTGNITLDNLLDDSYVMYLYVTTEKGEAVTSAYFTVSNSNFLENPPVEVGIASLMVLVIILGALVYFKKRKRQSLA
jgi:hypothetical protein